MADAAKKKPSGRQDRSTDKETPKKNVKRLKSTSTPVKELKKIKENDDSLLGLSQPGNDDIEVAWDWNSPQSCKRPQRSAAIPKRAEISTHAKIKRPQFDNDNFEKIRNELQALREEIAKGGEDWVPLSPSEEEKIQKDVNSSLVEASSLSSLIEPPLESQPRTLDDLFDDSADEDLFLCSQQIENELESKPVICDNKDEIKKRSETSANFCFNNKTETQQKSIKPTIKIELDDSIDRVFSNIKDDQIEMLTQKYEESIVKKVESKAVVKEEPFSCFKRTNSDANVEYNYQGKVKKEENSGGSFQRTCSFESVQNHKQENISESILKMIEKNKMEALARRQAMIKPTTDTNIPAHMPIKCSPEEIERKRLQALEKLKAKKLEAIEKNRQEALKRLKQNQMKMNPSSNSYPKRL